MVVWASSLLTSKSSLPGSEHLNHSKSLHQPLVFIIQKFLVLVSKSVIEANVKQAIVRSSLYSMELFVGDSLLDKAEPKAGLEYHPSLASNQKKNHSFAIFILNITEDFPRPCSLDLAFSYRFKLGGFGESHLLQLEYSTPRY